MTRIESKKDTRKEIMYDTRKSTNKKEIRKRRKNITFKQMEKRIKSGNPITFPNPFPLPNFSRPEIQFSLFPYFPRLCRNPVLIMYLNR